MGKILKCGLDALLFIIICFYVSVGNRWDKNRKKIYTNCIIIKTL